MISISADEIPIIIMNFEPRPLIKRNQSHSPTLTVTVSVSVNNLQCHAMPQVHKSTATVLGHGSASPYCSERDAGAGLAGIFLRGTVVPATGYRVCFLRDSSPVFLNFRFRSPNHLIHSL